VHIIKRVAKILGVGNEKIVSNIEELGNTGCASTVICLSQSLGRFKKDGLVLITVFGGGHSSGSVLVRG